MKKLFPKFIIISIISTLIITIFKFSKTIIKLIFSIFLFLISFIFLKGKIPFSKKEKDEKVYINYDDIEDIEDTLLENTAPQGKIKKEHFYNKKKDKKVIRRSDDFNIDKNLYNKINFDTDTLNFNNETKIYKSDYNNNYTGNKYIDELNLISENLNSNMKEKTLEIINISNKIFKISKKNNNEKLELELKKLLISTIRMLQEYSDLSILSFKTDNTIKTIESIENSMNKTIIAYYKLLNSVYEEILN